MEGGRTILLFKDLTTRSRQWVTYHKVHLAPELNLIKSQKSSRRWRNRGPAHKL